MARKFQILRGPASRLPVLAQAEPAMTTDAGAEKVLIGTGSGNLELALMRDLNSHSGDGVKHITAAERVAWNGKAAGNHGHTPESIGAAAAVHNHPELSNEYVWEKNKEGIIYSIVETSNLGWTLDRRNTNPSYYLAPGTIYGKSAKATADGIIIQDTFVPPDTTSSLSELVDYFNSMTPFYMYCPSFDNWYKATTAKIAGSSGVGLSGFTLSVSQSTGMISYGYVNSDDPNAYPPSVSDSFSYVLIGKLGENTRVETGAYVGSGTYGNATKNSLKFHFKPYALLVWENKDITHSAWILLVRSAGNAKDGVLVPSTETSGPGDRTTVTFDNQTVSWFSTRDSGSQMNTSGTVYGYMAIGV